MSEQPISTPDPQLVERLRLHVDRLAGLIGPRHVGRPSSLESAATLITREFAAMGERVEHQQFPVRGMQTANLIVERSGAREPAEIVVLGAHYDTVDTTPGADDNASAIGVLIEAARLLLGQPLRRTVRFVAFTCEEAPHFYTDSMGSVVYARRCRERNERIVGMLCLEMVGYYSDVPGSQDIPPELPRILRPLVPRRGNFLAAVGNLRSMRFGWDFRRGFKRATRFPLFSISLPERVHSICLSDNSSFWDQGYPALMLTDTSFLRNPHYHRTSDTPETLDYDRMAHVTVGVAGGISRLAQR